MDSYFCVCFWQVVLLLVILFLWCLGNPPFSALRLYEVGAACLNSRFHWCPHEPSMPILNFASFNHNDFFKKILSKELIAGLRSDCSKSEVFTPLGLLSMYRASVELLMCTSIQRGKQAWQWAHCRGRQGCRTRDRGWFLLTLSKHPDLAKPEILILNACTFSFLLKQL